MITMEFNLVKSGISWLKKSLSEDDDGRQTRSAPLTAQGSINQEDASCGSSNVGQSSKLCQSLSTIYLEDGAEDMPDVIGSSSIFQEGDIIKLCPYLPSRLIGSSWRLVFSTDSNGFSLKSIYRRMSDYNGLPTLLLIQDTKGYRFGALVSDNFRVQESFYGTGETFLFSLGPEFRCYPWKKKNNMVINCSNDCISIGAGDGHFGITLDGDLNHGRTMRCETYENEPLTPNEDFSIKAVEVWTFE